MTAPRFDSENASGSEPVALSAAGANDSVFTLDQALALLGDRELSPDTIQSISRNTAAMNSRKARLALAAHGRTPRRIVLRLVRQFYTFDLMQFSLMPAVAADLKRIAEELLVARIASITLGERIALARRSSSSVAAALLLDREPRVWQTALENPRLKESGMVRALQRPGISPAFVKAVCHHPKWSLRTEVRMALLRNEFTPLARAIEFARRVPPPQLRDILHASRLPEKIKAYLRKDTQRKR